MNLHSHIHGLLNDRRGQVPDGDPCVDAACPTEHHDSIETTGRIKTVAMAGSWTTLNKSVSSMGKSILSNAKVQQREKKNSINSI